jgi:hypothetical protein
VISALTIWMFLRSDCRFCNLVAALGFRTNAKIILPGIALCHSKMISVVNSRLGQPHLTYQLVHKLELQKSMTLIQTHILPLVFHHNTNPDSSVGARDHIRDGNSLNHWEMRGYI